MVEGDDARKQTTSNVNQGRLNALDPSSSPIASISSGYPPPNPQVPGQFNYHPQHYKQLPEDWVDRNDAINETTPVTNLLSCYGKTPPKLLTSDAKAHALRLENGNFKKDVPIAANKTTNHVAKADFEQAIELTGYGKFHYLLLAICGLVSTSEEMDVISMSFILPSAQCDLNLNTQTKGWLNSIIFIGMMVGAYVWGSIADTLGRRKVLIVISFMNAICIVASSFSQTYMLFMIFRFLNGVA